MRAVPLSRTLRGVGRLWRRSPLDMPVEQKLKLWTLGALLGGLGQVAREGSSRFWI